MSSWPPFKHLIDIIITLKEEALGQFVRFGYFFRSVFWFLSQQTLVFCFWCLLWFAHFWFFSIWFLVFVKSTSSFFDVVFGFSYYVLFGFWFSSQNIKVTERNAWQAKCHGTVGDHASRMMPETSTLQVRVIVCSVCMQDFDLTDQGSHLAIIFVLVVSCSLLIETTSILKVNFIEAPTRYFKNDSQRNVV